jgi:hypothetical protein
LLDEEEMTLGAKKWENRFSDPFASWILQEEDYQHAH